MQEAPMSYKDLPLLVSKKILLEKFKKYEWKFIDFDKPIISTSPLILCTCDVKFKNAKFEIYYCNTEEELDLLNTRFQNEKTNKIKIRLWSYMKNLPNEYFITELDEMIFESSVQKALVDVAEILKQKNSL